MDRIIRTATLADLDAVAAVEAACGLLLPGGMVSVCVYPGHEEGTRELRALEEALA